MRILVTGGAGYIGSHTCVELLEAGYDVVVVDNLCNSKPAALERVEKISGKSLEFHQLDLRDKDALDSVFSQKNLQAVIHFAGLKAIGESVNIPISYYQNNIGGTLNLLELMDQHRVKNMVFSSSANVYGDPETLPITEDFPLSASSPYGRAKLMVEEMLSDLFISDERWNIAVLRYFNPVGAHVSGLIGEDPHGVPNNLMPGISRVAAGKQDKLLVFGGDYDTPDGSGIRDYIHVVDLARGHIRALEKLFQKPGLVTYNLGTGQGYSVIEMVNAFIQASGQQVPYEIVGRRAGDIAACWADVTKASGELGWQAEKGLQEMCEDAWHWQSSNPGGYV